MIAKLASGSFGRRVLTCGPIPALEAAYLHDLDAG
jgi:hypothetical protein